MFTTPISEITYEDVESFCDEWPEGVRVEYKRDMNIKKQIPKIVSSFANTYGGLFLIGVEADQTNNRVISILGIPQRNGIEEQIVQSALTGIYPAVIPEVKILAVPNSNNVVVVVRVDESVQAPHAIQNSTRIYINRIEQRISNIHGFPKYIDKRVRSSEVSPQLTVTARPIFPYRPLISASKIHESHQGPLSPPRRVTGGHFCYNENEYWELNVYGIVYHRVVLFLPPGERDKGIDYGVFLLHINYLMQRANKLYEDCEYQGNIKITAHLENIWRREVIDTENQKITANTLAEPVSFDTEIRVSKQCLARDLKDEKEQKDLIEELTCQLLWAFNIPTDKPHIRGKIRK